MSSSVSLSTTSTRWDARLWGVLLTVSIVIGLDALDVSMVGVALPAIQADLGLSTSALQWVVSGYVLGYGGLLLLGRRTAHREPVHQGLGGSVHGAGRAVHHHHDVPGGPGPQQGDQHLRRVRGQRLLRRARVLRPADRGRLALDVPAARADRAGRARGGVEADPVVPRRRRPRLRLP